MKYKIAAAAATVVLALAGCGSEHRPATPDSVAAQAGSTASGPVMSVKTAGETYLKLSAASNAAREAWMSAAAPTAADLAEHKQLAAQAAAATVAFSQGLQKHRWPDRAQPYVDALAEHLRQRAVAYESVAAAGTVPEYLAAAGQVPVTNSLTGDVRKALGLPEGAIVTGVTPR